MKAQMLEHLRAILTDAEQLVKQRQFRIAKVILDSIRLIVEELEYANSADH